MSRITNTGRQAWSVSGLNSFIRDKLQNEVRLQNIWVEGEILNLTYHSSGHIYFSLKDKESVINCTFFRNANRSLHGLKLSEGMEILARGGISLYLPRGNYQLNVTQVMLAGEGELRLKIEQLKKKLFKEGLFNPERKKTLPLLPVTLGVATAPTGAAIQDIIHVARNRYPTINIVLAPCLVQGDGAVNSIVSAIEALNEPSLGIDVIIAGRGGGSFEDLMAFNEEDVVRAFANSQIPIISAVGHEIDNPITDLAADAFSATPSAAAERAVPVLADIISHIEESALRFGLLLKNKYNMEQDRFMQLLKSQIYTNPISILSTPGQHLDLAIRDFRSAIKLKVNESALQLKGVNLIPVLFQKNLADFIKRYELAIERLGNFSPLATLKRGFAIVRNNKKNVIRKHTQVKKGENLEVLLDEGRIGVSVIETTETWQPNN